MSDVTAALLSHLEHDLSPYLDPYQMLLAAGKDPIWPDATVQQYQAFSLRRSILKKYNEKDYPSKEACDAALAKFLSVNNRLASHVVEPADIREEELLNGVRDAIERFYYVEGDTPLVSCLSQLYDSGRLGSGMNRRARGSDLYTKVWDSPLTATSDALLATWQALCVRDLRWSAAEKHRNHLHGSSIVSGNKLSFVNKNVTVARCICTEPTVNLWFQLGLEDILRRRLRRFWGIDFENQQHINKVLARRGSRTDRFATIDLESASDSVSHQLLDRILPASFKGWLYLIRSPVTELPGGSSASMSMVSTMGNGFTFPLQTIIFTAVVLTVYRHLGIQAKMFGSAMKRNLGVFGDDIIVDVRAYRLVVRLLELLGFVVNSEKTYSRGPFRESCGGDFVSGRHCRGVYIKTLQRKQDYAVAVNLLNRWSAATGIYLPRAVQYLLMQGRPLLVPPASGDDEGVQVPLDMASGVTHPYPGLVRYKHWKCVASTFHVEEDGSITMEVKGEVKRNPNPWGLHLAFLHGDIRGYRASLRQRRVRYRTKHSVIHNWNTLSPQCRALRLDWQRWSSAVYYNFSL